MSPAVLLAGRPNTGKTTLFNALTGLRQRVANFAGCTVERAEGLVRVAGGEFEVVDLPGTFSISSGSQDESIAFSFLAQAAASRALLVLCVAEASNLANDAALACALKAAGYPVLLVVNMIDEARLNGIEIDAAALSRELGMPVHLISARKRQGLGELRAAFKQVSDCPRALDLEGAPRERLEELHICATRRAEAACLKAVRVPGRPILKTISRSIRVDRWLFHPLLGPLALALTLFLVFQSLFALGEPAKDWLAALMDSASLWLRPHLPGSLLPGLVCDGFIAGFSAVATFVPQIAILFLLIGALEQSGYLPRAGAMVDRALRPFGLDGKVFIPFLSSFACAIPGVMAARTIPNEKRRLTAVLLCPLMTCSARLPVYALIIAAFVSPAFRPLGLDGRAVVMGGLYVFGVLTALLIALALRWTSLYEAQPMPVTVLPPYRLPKPSELARYVWTRCWHFISRAGRVIFMLSLLLWALGSFPRAPKGSAPSVQIEQSLLGRAGRLVEPVFRPIGYDWKISVGVLSSLAAREVFVGTMGSLTAMSGRAATTEELARTLQRDYGLPTAVSLLLFFAVALQCVSTIAIVRRETGGWKWPLIQFACLFVLAYALSFAGYHLTKFLV
ncbi:MAG: ferrous iron transporter B [Elusimicrobia bacterium]|nr:ferrous iron transporter B [Elusimicrobiota bacterium]MDE2424899.1 ferrous iron transporter B [Elusimicrobiota bacterium]